MHTENNTVLLCSMPFAGTDIASIQLAILKSYLEQKNQEIRIENLYLKAADIFDIKNYNQLIYPPNDSYTAQIGFTKYLFPTHFDKKQPEIKKYYEKNTKLAEQLTFETYLERTNIFLNYCIEKTNWQNYDIIGFTLNYGQFLPSLAFAKKIKDFAPNKKIILGGSRTTGILGVHVLDAFHYIDYIVSGDGEEALYLFAENKRSFSKIPNLIYRENNQIRRNPEQPININQSPIPDYEPFYQQLQQSLPETQQFYQYYGKLPIEISRGCWWNKCTFCNLNIQHQKYREKNIDKIISEIDFLSEKYKNLSFQIIGNTLPLKNHKKLCEDIIKLGKDFTFYAEARADKIERSVYKLLKKAGFKHIQTGIESFSENYIKKMNKGTNVIQNIAALKYSKENQIKNHYNLIINYPNEEEIDFIQTKKTIEQIQQYLDPPQICKLRILHGSHIQQNPQEYNIKNLTYSYIDKLMFPIEILEKRISFIYDFETQQEKTKYPWQETIDEWRQEKQKREQYYLKTQTTIDKNIYFYQDGKTFLRIYDKRNPQQIKIYNLDEKERKIFLSCLEIKTNKQINNLFPEIPEEEIYAILKTLEENGIIYREYDSYLSLPLTINKHSENTLRYKKAETEEQQIQI